MFFQGQEFGSSKPFLFFSDLGGDFSRQVAEGRRKFLSQFPSIADARLDDPEDPSTFQRCVLDWSEHERNQDWPRLFRSLIALRRSDQVICMQRQHEIDLAALSNELFIARMYGADGCDRLLAFNFGRDFAMKIVPEPLLAPPAEMKWQMIWSSEDPGFGGSGRRFPENEKGDWIFQGECCSVLAAMPAQDALVELG